MKAWLARLAGSTPTVPLRDQETGCTIWVKLEYMLPSGSTKDRVASFILSHAIETELIGLGAPVRKLTMLPLPVADSDAMRFDRSEARASFGFGPEDLVICTIGRAVPVKGWDVLLRALVVLRAYPFAALRIRTWERSSPETEMLDAPAE